VGAYVWDWPGGGFVQRPLVEGLHAMGVDAPPAGGLTNSPLRKDRALLEWRHCLPQIQAPVLMLNGQIDPIYPVKKSQEPMFQLLGSPIKEHYVHPNGHHMLPPAVKFEQMQRWFDRHLGTPAKGRQGDQHIGKVNTQV
jgi:pimeloyl-ACP methyl ester carboxylesterase